MERQQFSAPKQKMPLTFDILFAVKPFLKPRSDDDNVKWAALTTGHFLMLRAREITVSSSDHFDSSIHLTFSDAKLRTSADGSE